MKPIMIAVVAAVLWYLLYLAHLQLLASLWIPSAMLLFLVAFPAYTVIGQVTMLQGLFDLDLSPKARLPIRHFVVTLASFAVAGSALSMAQLVLLNGPARFGIPTPHLWPWVAAWTEIGIGSSACRLWWLLALLSALAAWVAGFAIYTSYGQDHGRSLWRMIAGALAAIAAGDAVVWLLVRLDSSWLRQFAQSTMNSCIARWLGEGYAGTAWHGNLAALLAFLATLVLYAALGVYGYKSLGTGHTVAALLGPLMAVLMLGWAGTGTEFFLGHWHIPLFLVIVIGGVVNTFIPLGDHTYKMVNRATAAAAPTPFQVLTAQGRRCAIVVGSAGGGIQAAAWTTQVLEGLHANLGAAFDKALCMISSISGGSMGSVCYVNWLANAGSAALPTPFAAASASSLDEVAWGLAWPDLLRLFFPFPFGMFIDRAGAMERAWVGNASAGNGPRQLDDPLSNWNQATATGALPALVMSSTMVEVGGPLLLGTSDVNGADCRASTPWMDGDRLHVQGIQPMDVPAVRAARLSASFPYVSPTARPAKANQQPHIIDGGIYDTYGMATLSEWLDQALEEQAAKMPGNLQVERVLVLQLNGFPDDQFGVPAQTKAGWPLQLTAMFDSLSNVRVAGQVSHRNIELTLLQQKWQTRGVEILNLNFALNNPNAPLSWHLMPKQIKAVTDGWAGDPDVQAAKQQVASFLAGA